MSAARYEIRQDGAVIERCVRWGAATLALMERRHELEAAGWTLQNLGRGYARSRAT